MTTPGFHLHRPEIAGFRNTELARERRVTGLDLLASPAPGPVVIVLHHDRRAGEFVVSLTGTVRNGVGH